MLQPGMKFTLRQTDADGQECGATLSCVVISRLDDCRILAHVGLPTEEVTALYLTSDEFKAGVTTTTAIGVCGSDIEMDVGYPARMMSDYWAGTLFVVLD